MQHLTTMCTNHTFLPHLLLSRANTPVRCSLLPVLNCSRLSSCRARLDLELAEKLATEEASQRGMSVGEIAPLLEAALVELRAREKDSGDSKPEAQERGK